MANLKAEIAAANKELMEAFKTKTPSWIAKMYAPDALLMPPGATTVMGEDNICKFWQSVLDSGICDVELETLTLDEADTSVTEVGHYRLHSEESLVDHGKYVVVWKKVEDEWRLFRDIWNSDPAGHEANR
jgi:ketosteroid isomerase-like protein